MARYFYAIGGHYIRQIRDDGDYCMQVFSSYSQRIIGEFLQLYATKQCDIGGFEIHIDHRRDQFHP